MANPDVPTLDLAWQADRLIAPVTKWGTIARSAPMPGTYHFYTDDYRFVALWDRPEQLAASGCHAAVEVNYSTFARTSPEGAFWTVYRKRSLSACWGRHGVKLIVDLNVDLAHLGIALDGVPAGWRAYAARVHADEGYDAIETRYAMAARRAGTDDLLFAVFGGGKSARGYCESRGWTHVPEHVHVASKRVPAYARPLQA